MKKVKVKVPASTTNLGPGFDTLGIALKLYNTIEFQSDGWLKRGTTRLTVAIQGHGQDSLPRNKTNLVYQSAQKVFDILKKQPANLHLELINRIPLASGLGSSAAARIGGLIAANKLCGNKLTTDQILNLAVRLEGHPDNVAPALLGGFVASCLSKQGVKYVKFGPLPHLSIVICIPDFQVSTKLAREVLPGKIPFSSGVFNTNRVALLLGALTMGKYDLLSWAMQDRLHQPFRKKLMPHMDDVINSALKAGSAGAALSGAGPSIVAFVAKKTQRIGQAMTRAFAKHRIKSRSFILKIDKKGTRCYP